MMLSNEFNFQWLVVVHDRRFSSFLLVLLAGGKLITHTLEVLVTRCCCLKYLSGVFFFKCVRSKRVKFKNSESKLL